MASLLARLLEGKGHETGVHGRALRDFTWSENKTVTACYQALLAGGALRLRGG